MYRVPCGYLTQQQQRGPGSYIQRTTALVLATPGRGMPVACGEAGKSRLQRALRGGLPWRTSHRSSRRVYAGPRVRVSLPPRRNNPRAHARTGIAGAGLSRPIAVPGLDTVNKRLRRSQGSTGIGGGNSSGAPGDGLTSPPSARNAPDEKPMGDRTGLNRWEHDHFRAETAYPGLAVMRSHGPTLMCFPPARSSR